ncbi:MAG: 2-C-methyl-D-erythritol 4-phosphate cytidylyltransferase [Candidatus Neomarinimicrobiota bacterium]
MSGVDRMRVSALIAGAGKSVRFAGDTESSSEEHRKQFQHLGQEPLIFVTLQPFVESSSIDSILVAVPPNTVEWMEEMVKSRGFEKEVKVIPGGRERQDTVWQGLKEVAHSCDVIVVHDGVRPFFKGRWIRETVDLCSNFDGAIVAVHATDTLKRVKNETILETLSRGEIWQAQTPQTFNVDVLVAGYEHALSLGLRCTDEAQLVELNGGRIAIVEGSPQNIKITRSEDWKLAESIWHGMNRD